MSNSEVALGSGWSSGSWIISNVSNCSLSIPSRTPAFILSLQVIVGAVSVLSLLGSALILLTFVCFKDLRTTARHFLANLSVADSILAASHLVGLLANYRRFICSSETDAGDALCAVQAAATMFATLATFAWTLAIAVYMCSIVVFRRRAAVWSVGLSYAACWGIPAALVIGYGSAGYLGFDEEVDIGWCYLRRINYQNEKSRNPIPHLLAYELWTYIVFLLLPILYVWVQCYIKIKIKSLPIFMDIKLVFVPVLFLLLRVWNFVLDCLIVYTSEDTAKDFKESTAAAVLILMAGVGDSSQGIVNAVLFIGLTRVVRRRLLDVVADKCCRRCRKEQWTVLREADQMAGRANTHQTGEGESKGTGECEESSYLESDSLEGLQVLSFQSSVSSYGTTSSGD